MSTKGKTNFIFFYGWVIVIVTLVAGAVLLGTRQSYGVFFKSIENEFGLNRAVTSGIFSVYMALSAVFSVLGGWALDRFGPKRTIAAMGFFTGLGLLLTSQAHSIWQLYLTFCLILAVGTGETYTVVSAAVSKWFQKKRGLALGISQAGGGIGLLIIAPFATYLIIRFDWRTAYIVMGVISLLFVLGPSVLLRKDPNEMGLLPDGTKKQKLQNVIIDKANGFTLKETFRTNQFWVLFFVWLLHGTATYITTTHIVPHATDLGISAIAASTILSVFAIFNIIGGLFIGALSDAIGRKVVAIICAIIGAAAMLWLIWIPNNTWLFYIFAALFGIPFGGISTAVTALAGDMFGTHSLGKILGWLGISWFLGAAIGPFIAGIIYDTYGGYFLAFLIGALCMLAVILLLTLLRKPKPMFTT